MRCSFGDGFKGHGDCGLICKNSKVEDLPNMLNGLSSTPRIITMLKKKKERNLRAKINLVLKSSNKPAAETQPFPLCTASLLCKER